MKKYDSYKDSGVEWIGEIPSHWTTPKLSFYCEVKDGTHSTPTYVDDGYPLVTQKDITKGKLDFSKTKNISKEDYDEINRRSNVVFGDIIMSMIGSIGNPTIVDTEIPFSIKNVCLFKTSESNELTNFIHYFLNSSVLMTELELKSRGGVQGFVSLDVLRNISFIKPPLPEQQQIVSFLDTKTSLIDSLIEKTQRKIELLKEKRTSLINEVVTKGLNPNVEMKDSGVEWIGEIPSHWKKTKHKFNLSILSGYPFKSELFDNSEGFPLIRIRDISSGKIETYYQGEVLDKFVVKKGDLLIGMDGDFNTRWWDSEQGLLNQRCCSIFEGSDVLRRYLHYILPIELNIINDLTYYTTVKHLSVDDINNTDTILPPLSEQQQIVSYLDEQTQLIDKTISIEERRIELLKEYRQSLISEVVTGKLKVVE